MASDNQQKVNIVTYLIALFLKLWYVLPSIIVGLMAKFSYELTRQRKMSLWVWAGITGLSVAAGCLTSWICDYEGWIKVKTIATCLSTLFGEKIFEFAFSQFDIGEFVRDYVGGLLEKIKKSIKITKDKDKIN